MSEGIVDAKTCSFGDYLCLAHVYDGSVYSELPLVLDGGCGGEVCGLFERAYEFGSTVGVAAIVGRIYADEDIKRGDDFGPGKGKAQKYSVSGWYVGDRYILFVVRFGAVFGDIDFRISEGRASELAQVDVDYTVLDNGEGFCDIYC